MPIRWSKNWNDLLKERMNAFGATLEANFTSSTIVTHTNVKGDIRARTIAEELRKNLPGTFEIAFNCIAIDFKWKQSWELDIVIYNKLLNNPLFSTWGSDDKNLILPIEAVLSVIEVKSKLNATEYSNIGNWLDKLYSLKPWKENLTPKDVKEKLDTYRIFYTAFWFDTDLVPWDDWIKREFWRIPKWLIDKIDRVVFPNLGIINPASGKGRKLNGDDPKWSIILEWYINLINFLVRENSRRKPVDWQNYMHTFARWWEAL